MADGVVQQVVQHPIKLRGIALDARQWQLQVTDQLDLLVRSLVGNP